MVGTAPAARPPAGRLVQDRGHEPPTDASPAMVRVGDHVGHDPGVAPTLQAHNRRGVVDGEPTAENGRLEGALRIARSIRCCEPEAVGTIR